MANPFGIEQVDIPSLLGMHQQMKRQRIADLMAAREYELKAKEATRQDRKDQVLARIFMKGGDQASGGTGTATQPPASDVPASSPTVALTAGAVPAAAPHPLDGHELGQPLPPRTDGLSLNMDALRDLYAIDPQGASQIQKMIYDSNEQQLKAATARGEAMAIAADALKSVPPGERQAQFQSRWAPWLAERGWTPELLKRADMSDQSLDGYYRQGMSLKDVIAQNKPDLRVIPAGGTVYDVRGNKSVAQNPNPPTTLPADFDFGDGGPTPTASGNFPASGN